MIQLFSTRHSNCRQLARGNLESAQLLRGCQCGTSPSLRRQFLRDIAGDLKRDKQLRLSDFDPDKDLSELDVDEQQTAEGFSLSWPRAKRALIIGAVIAVIAWLLIELGSITDFVKED